VMCMVVWGKQRVAALRARDVAVVATVVPDFLVVAMFSAVAARGTSGAARSPATHMATPCS
jgi:hypothetical protein